MCAITKRAEGSEYHPAPQRNQNALRSASLAVPRPALVIRSLKRPRLGEARSPLCRWLETLSNLRFLFRNTRCWIKYVNTLWKKHFNSCISLSLSFVFSRFDSSLSSLIVSFLIPKDAHVSPVTLIFSAGSCNYHFVTCLGHNPTHLFITHLSHLCSESSFFSSIFVFALLLFLFYFISSNTSQLQWFWV